LPPLDLVLQQIFRAAEAAEGGDDGITVVRTFLAGAVSALIRDAIKGLSVEAARLANLAHVVMVRVFSGSATCPFVRSAKGSGGAKCSRQFDTSIATMRKGIELAALRRVEQPSVAGLAPAEARCSKVRAEDHVPHTAHAAPCYCPRCPHRARVWTHSHCRVRHGPTMLLGPCSQALGHFPRV
jgi:hypothetical protein